MNLSKQVRVTKRLACFRGASFAVLAILVHPLFGRDIEKITMKDESFRIEWHDTERFEDTSWRDRWVVESQGPRVFNEFGQLKVRPIEDTQLQAGVTIWRRQKLPSNVVIQVKASTDARVQYNACNLNFFVHATEIGGAPLIFGRTGNYPDYHKIPNYVFTFTGRPMPDRPPSGWARARLNPGFQLISERADLYSDPGKSYQFMIVIQDKHVRYYLDGEKIHDFTVENPLPGGWFGLRTWFSLVNFHEVRIGQLLP